MTYSIPPKKKHQNPPNLSLCSSMPYVEINSFVPNYPKSFNILSDFECTYFQTEAEQGMSRGLLPWGVPNPAATTVQTQCRHPNHGPPGFWRQRREPWNRLLPRQWLSGCRFQWGGTLHEATTWLPPPSFQVPHCLLQGQPSLPKGTNTTSHMCR